jgi:maleate isomerase
MRGEGEGGVAMADERRNKDALGYRAKIGILVPATNTIVEPEMAAMQPPGVTNHVSRMSRVKRPAHDLELYKKFLGKSVDMDAAIDLLVALEPNMIVHGHSVDSFVGGRPAATAMKKHMEAVSGGVPVMLPSFAMLKALETIGKPKALGILTPWMPPADEACKAFFEESGYAVPAIKGLKHPTPLDIATATPALINAAVDEINVPGVECIVKVGTNSSMAFITADIERRIGKPVLTVNTVVYWAGLRALGIQDKLKGFGRLAETH